MPLRWHSSWPSVRLTENFTLAELTASDIAARKGVPNDPPPAVVDNLKRLATFLEQVRLIVGRPVIINSAYRSPAVNKLVGGQPNSQHLLGLAADIRVPGMTPDEVVKAIREAGLAYDQVIREFNSWTHVSIPDTAKTPRQQALIIDRLGVRAYA